jgi:putative PIN family toxin of toxin-antitoxin system
MPCAPSGGKAPVRIVLDTNVVVSALLWRGTPHRLRDAIRQRPDAQLYTSAALLDELVRVLARSFAAKRLALIGVSARTLVTDYALAADLVTPLAVPSVIAADPDDDRVIAAAVAAEADLVVSGDRHLLALGTHQSIRIVSPAEAIALIAP